MSMLETLVDWYVSQKLNRIRSKMKENILYAESLVKEHNLKNVQDVKNFLSQYKYVLDPGFGLFDQQNDIKTFIEKGEGDCDDWTLAYYRLLSALDYEVYYTTLVDSQIIKSHAVCLFRAKKKDNLRSGCIYSADQKAIIGPFESKDSLISRYNKINNADYCVVNIRTGDYLDYGVKAEDLLKPCKDNSSNNNGGDNIPVYPVSTGNIWYWIAGGGIVILLLLLHFLK